jgi:hypothetical protein
MTARNTFLILSHESAPMPLTYSQAADEIERRMQAGMAQANARRQVWQENAHLSRDRLRVRHNEAKSRGREAVGGAWADVLARLQRQRFVTVQKVRYYRSRGVLYTTIGKTTFAQKIEHGVEDARELRAA